MTKVTSKGQVTIPKEIREELGIEAGDEIKFEETDGGVLLKKQADENPFEKYQGMSDSGETVEDWMEKFREE
ncbi:AbrB/MazE/SpoVT family DNA-binding domain-containing protein [Halorutilales archaeon Cl-col2-1]